MIAVLSVSAIAGAAERQAGDADELRAAITAANAGDVVVLRDGTWTDVAINVTTAGVTLRAQTPGKVVLAGSSKLKLSAPNVVVDGLHFEGGALTGDDGQVIHFNSDHGRVTSCAIVDYNPRDVETPYYWIFFEGHHNRLDHCYVKGKSHQEPVIGNAGGGSSPRDSKKPSRHNTVDHCHFVDIPHVPGRNGREIFRIWGYGGNEELGEDGSFFTIEDNLFERAHGEGNEIISLKSNRNIVRRNTVRATRGGITNRSGNFNVIEDNIILADGEPRATGIRVAGQGHVIRGNYLEGTRGGINLVCGEHFESDLTGSFQPILRDWAPLKRVPRYGHVRNVTIENNFFVDIAGDDLIVGSGYKSGWPKSQRVLLPEGLTVAKNTIIKPSGGDVIVGTTPDRNPPLDRFVFEPNRFEGNVVVGDSAQITLDAAKPGFATRAEPPHRPKPKPLTAQDVGPAWRK